MSLTDKAKKLQDNPRRPLAERLTKKQLAELNELKKNYQNGELVDVSDSALAQLVRKEFELKTLNPQTLKRFLNEPFK
tara:strand:+ start:149 stop:382 length:234 start_codon:yes stop_codon:yes gene_type:complete